MLDEHGVRTAPGAFLCIRYFLMDVNILRIFHCNKTRNCSQTLRQHQLCLIENISYDNSSDAFSVRLKLYRCRKMQTM
ncbi:Uncharacterized protein BM_BM1604 [Brugia malayi]|uniref:Bm1604 n=1 Tax=Brugia malayi TaxID=6279 RepID=A0A4E9FR39_BRUMA|nr:Uncharacterized protein BM_BM1604 [Brugia malayi]VIO99614.1 Uncharacterized protein BM_BM1604 [Brugia malayi]